MFSSWTGLPKRHGKCFELGMLILHFQRFCCATIGASLLGIIYTVIQRNVFAHTVYVIDLLLNVTYIIKCQWLEYLFIDSLNTDEELCALSLFTFSLQPNVVEAGKLQN